MGYATKSVKRRRHNYNRKIMGAAALGGAYLEDWMGLEAFVIRVPHGHKSLWGYNYITLWKYAAKCLGVK